MAKPQKPKLADLLKGMFDLKKRMEALDMKRAPLEREYAALEEQVLLNFTEEELAGVRVAGGIATRVPEDVPSVKDWEKVYKWILKSKRFELLQRRITKAVWIEQREAKKPVPGIEVFTKVSLKLTAKKR